MRPGARLDAIVEILKILLDQSLFPNFTNDEISEKQIDDKEKNQEEKKIN